MCHLLKQIAIELKKIITENQVVTQETSLLYPAEMF